MVYADSPIKLKSKSNLSKVSQVRATIEEEDDKIYDAVQQYIGDRAVLQSDQPVALVIDTPNWQDNYDEVMQKLVEANPELAFGIIPTAAYYEEIALIVYNKQIFSAFDFDVSDDVGTDGWREIRVRYVYVNNKPVTTIEPMNSKDDWFMKGLHHYLNKKLAEIDKVIYEYDRDQDLYKIGALPRSEKILSKL